MKKPYLGAAIALLLLLTGCGGSAASSQASSSAVPPVSSSTANPISEESEETASSLSSDATSQSVSSARESGVVPLSELPKPYTSELAVKNGDVVFTTNQARNVNKLEDFMTSVGDAEPAHVRIALWGESEGPLFRDLTFDGKKIYAIFSDSAEPEESIEYTGISTKERYNETLKATFVDVYLYDGQGGQRTVCSYTVDKPAPPASGQEDLVEMMTGQSTYEPDVKKIKLTIRNGSQRQMLYGEDFELQRRAGGEWRTIEPETELNFNSVGILVDGGKDSDYLMSLNGYASPLKTGKYRVAKTFSFEDAAAPKQSYLLYANFNIVESIDALRLERPREIQSSIGNGKSRWEATLTRKQTYEGRTPVAYVVDQLADFKPLPPEWKLVGESSLASGTLDLHYDDDTNLTVELDPSRSRLLENGKWEQLTLAVYNGQTYYGVPEAYERILACIVATAGA